MKRNRMILFLATPFLCLALGFLVMASHKGLPMQKRPDSLPPIKSTELPDREEQVELLLLSEEEDSLLRTVEDTLGEMKIGWICSNHLDPKLLEGVHTVLLCSPHFSGLDGEGAVSLFQWVEKGGRFGVLISQETSGLLSVAGHKLGILDRGTEYARYESFRAADGVLPVFRDLSMNEELEDYALPVHLESDCRVLLSSDDGTNLPLLWSRDLGEGRIAYCNHSLISGKDSRGQLLFVLRALEDVLVYPIINAGMIFIDDFPAPQPEGFDERLKQQYGLSIQGFYRNHWWPDMKALARAYGLRYTGVLVETYNKTMHPPFAPDEDDHSLIRYYTSELLQSGGEVGLHGYNHQPLCPDGWQYAGEDYTTWDSAEDMAQAVKELVRYGHSFLPDASFTSYVPPSNYLSPLGQQVLLDTVSSLLAISGVYLPEDGIHALVQEFEELPDGSVSVPRITSGFHPDVYVLFEAVQELGLHGVFSHFIHPDDVLDVERGAEFGWEQLRDDFDAMLSEITQAYPALRWCSATQAAAAVQRYDRAWIERQWEGDTLTLTLSPFYDELWLCLWAEQAPAYVAGAELYEAGGGALWLRATQSTVTLDWETGE